MGRDPKSLGETARSSSKARMSVKSSTLVLYIGKGDSRKILEHDVDAYEQKKKNARLTPQVKIENRYRLEVLH